MGSICDVPTYILLPSSAYEESVLYTLYIGI